MTAIHSTKWKIFLSRLRKYLEYYGGWKEVFGSPFFNLAVVLSLANWQLWESKWVQLSQSLIPSMLGFALGTYAILFSIISVRLKKALKEVKNRSGVSYLHEMNATFFHFIFVQVLGVLLTFIQTGTAPWTLSTMLFGKSDGLESAFSIGRLFIGAVGTTLLIYSLLLAVAAAMIVYRLATIVEPDKP